MAKFERTKPHVNVGTIGCVDNRKTLLTAALAKVARLESATTRAEVGGLPRRILPQVLSAPEHMPMRTLLESAGRRALSIHESDQLVNLVATLAAEANSWRDAVINELVVAFIYTKEHDSNPRKAVQDAITWNCQVSLDPRVSSDAAALIEPYKSQLAEATRRLGEVEGLLREAVGHMTRGRAYYSEYHDFIERIAALTKESTK